MRNIFMVMMAMSRMTTQLQDDNIDGDTDDILMMMVMITLMMMMMMTRDDNADDNNWITLYLV